MKQSKENAKFHPRISTCIVTPCQWPGFICGHKGFIYIYIYVHVWTRGLQNQEEF